MARKKRISFGEQLGHAVSDLANAASVAATGSELGILERAAEEERNAATVRRPGTARKRKARAVTKKRKAASAKKKAAVRKRKVAPRKTARAAKKQRAAPRRRAR